MVIALTRTNVHQVYCGECAKNRSKASGKSKVAVRSKTKPLSKCVVDGCAKSTKGTSSMVSLYL